MEQRELTEVDTSHNHIRIIPIGIGNVTETQHIELRIPVTARSMEW